ncbi:MAG: hypothetical protein CRN43_17425 [Candidatus Nephrothrix sp. EaCA]|nr:MAG: hypothetical protein CRN43_17425 [Candidatus Nephrothrix sp. EaCA]
MVLEAHYLPCLEYFWLARQHATLEPWEWYEKQSYRNRAHIAAAHGAMTLTVPVHVFGKMRMNETPIDYRQKWQNQHWRTIESAYRKAPFFEHYADELKNILYEKHPSLFELNYNLIAFAWKALSFPQKMELTNSWSEEEHPTIHPKKKSHYKGKPYRQVFSSDFLPNLSFIDVLFCTGPQANKIICNS